MDQIYAGRRIPAHRARMTAPLSPTDRPCRPRHPRRTASNGRASERARASFAIARRDRLSQVLRSNQCVAHINPASKVGIADLADGRQPVASGGQLDTFPRLKCPALRACTLIRVVARQVGQTLHSIIKTLDEIHLTKIVEAIQSGLAILDDTWRCSGRPSRCLVVLPTAAHPL